MPNHQRPSVVFQPRTRAGIQRGVNRIVETIRPTLGPYARSVVVAPELKTDAPAIYDNGGDIARRIIQIRGRDEDVGAMLVREMLWRLQKQVGDGTATAAVIFGTIYNEGVRYLTAGGNGRRLQSHLNAGMHEILTALSRQAVHLESETELARLAQSISHDPELSRYLGEIFHVVGELGRLEIRKGRSREIEREYVEGMYWERGLVSRQMIADWEQMRTEFENAAILVSDLDVERPGELFPVLELALQNDIRSLVIVAQHLSDSALNFLLTNRRPDRLQVIAVATPEYSAEKQMAALEDMAVLTGAKPFFKAVGDTFQRATAHDLGHARRVWATLQNFGIMAGQGDPKTLRNHVHELRNAYQQAETIIARDWLRKRIGKLLGGSATLWVGGVTESEMERRVEIAERTAAAMRLALEEGVIPGGGVALLACRSSLQKRLAYGGETDERAAYAMLIKALAAPTLAIIANAGYDASEVMADLRHAAPTVGFDVANGRIVEMMETGVYDPVSVIKAAVHSAISTAAMALTIDVVVHHANPEQAKPLRQVSRVRL